MSIVNIDVDKKYILDKLADEKVFIDELYKDKIVFFNDFGDFSKTLCITTKLPKKNKMFGCNGLFTDVKYIFDNLKVLEVEYMEETCNETRTMILEQKYYTYKSK
jgi:hypothetical protein